MVGDAGGALTQPELDALAHRWQVAQLLDEGLPYLEVAKRAHASTTTVKNRVVSTHPFGPTIPIQSSERPSSQVGISTAFVRVALRCPKVR